MEQRINTFTMYEVYFDNGYITLLTEQEFKYLKDNDYVRAVKIDNLCWIDNVLYTVKLDETGTEIVKKEVYRKYTDLTNLKQESASVGECK